MVLLSSRDMAEKKVRPRIALAINALIIPYNCIQ